MPTQAETSGQPRPSIQARRALAEYSASTNSSGPAGLPTVPGLPATAVPAGRSPEGLPVGVQIIGPMFEDRTPLRLAELLEREIGGFRAPEQGVPARTVPAHRT